MNASKFLHISISVLLVLPTLLAILSLVYIRAVYDADSTVLNAQVNVPISIGSWQGSEIKISDQARNLDPHSNLIYRQYSNGTGQIIEMILRQGSVYRGVHDAVACLDYAGWQPKRIGTLHISTKQGPLNVSLISFKSFQRNIVGLVWYWSAQGTTGDRNYWHLQRRFSGLYHLVTGATPIIRQIELVTQSTGNIEADKLLLVSFAKNIFETIKPTAL